MTAPRDLERRLTDFYSAQGALRAPDRVLTSALAIIETTPQRRVLGRVPWRFPNMNTYARLGVAAVAVIAVAAGGWALYSGRAPNVGTDTSPTPLQSPPTTANTSPAAGSSPAASSSPNPQDALNSPLRTLSPGGGGLLAFIRDGDVYLSRDDGSEPLLVMPEAHARGPIWSPDGRYLAVAAAEQTLLLDTTTMEVRRLSPELGWVEAWAPDSQSILVNQVVGTTGMQILQIFDLEDGTSRQIGSFGGLAGSVCLPVLSPDGRWIAAVRRSDTIVIDVLNGESSPIGTYAGYGCGPATGWDAPTWSADSERLAWVSKLSPPAAFGEPQTTTITVAQRDGNQAVELTSSAGAWARPLWSPDGQWIAYRRPDGLGLIRPHGSDSRLLVEGEVDRARIAWTADSAHIEFGRPVYWDPSGPAELWTVDVATGTAGLIEVGGPVADFARQP